MHSAMPSSRLRRSPPPGGDRQGRTVTSGRRLIRRLEMTGSDFHFAREHRVEQLVEASRRLPREPAIAAGGTLLHRDAENDSDLAISLCHLGSVDRLAVSLGTACT